MNVFSFPFHLVHDYKDPVRTWEGVEICRRRGGMSSRWTSVTRNNSHDASATRKKNLIFFSPKRDMCSPKFKPGIPSEEAQVLSRQLKRVEIRISHASQAYSEPYALMPQKKIRMAAQVGVSCDTRRGREGGGKLETWPQDYG